MGVSSSGRGLLRLLLGAALLLLGWFLASSTSAHADDRATVASIVSAVGAADDATRPVEQLVEESVASVSETVDAAASVVEEAVAATPVAPVAEKPVVAATTAVSKAVSAVTTQVVDPVVDTVVEVVVEATDDVVAVPPSGPAPVEVTPVPGAGDPVAVDRPRAPLPGALRAEETERGSIGGAHDVAAGSQVAPLFGVVSQDVARERPAAPSDREPVVPWPDWDLGAPATLGSAPSSGLVLSLAVLGMALFLVRPELRCAAARAGRRVPPAGPYADPGSRPD